MGHLKTPAIAGALGIALLSVGSSHDEASAGAFQLNERSALAQGTSFAGSVSSAADITHLGFNPATLGAIDGFQMGGSLSMVAPKADAEIVTGPAAGATEDVDRTRAVLGAAAGFRVNEWLAIGVASYSPFGLVSQYQPNSPFSADAVTSELLTVVFAPTVAVTPVEGLTFGVSLNVIYAEARLTSAITNLDAENFGLGFSVGVLYEPFEGTRFGASYHHGYDLNLEGEQESSLIPIGPVPMRAQASLPGLVQVGMTQDLTENLTVMIEGRYIMWSAFDQIDVQSPSFPPPLNSFADVQNYDDAFFVAVGAEYDLTDAFSVRGGVAFDQTPTNDTFRTLRVPDADRVWFSVGASYDMNEHMSADIAYSYLYGLETISTTLRNGPLAGSRVETDGGAHILTVGGSLKF